MEPLISFGFSMSFVVVVWQDFPSCSAFTAYYSFYLVLSDCALSRLGMELTVPKLNKYINKWMQKDQS